MFLLHILSYFLLSIPATTELGNDPAEEIQILNTEELLAIIKTSDDTVRLFNFWATWCKPCVQELPYIEETNTLKKNEKFRIYLISLDFKKNYKRKLIPFLKQRNIQSTVYLFDGGNPNDWIDRIEPSWGGSIPASLISYKGKTCFEESSFENTLSLNTFINHCTSNFKL